MPPFMSYVAYSTYNYRFADPSIGTSKYSNLRLVRAFEHGLDPLSSEAGFVLTHVDMVKHSPSLVKGVVDTLASVSSRANPAEISSAFHHMLEAMQRIEASMETMWANSRPKDYIQYRTFIFGITNQSMFPDGVVYEGENNGEPMSFRGESGANDSIIPLLDNLLQIPMPQNPLTSILKDFRSYRPKPHREFLEFVGARAEEVGVKEYCCKDAGTAVLYLRLLEHVRSFRWRHWLFAREYIIRRTSHPTVSFLARTNGPRYNADVFSQATGGSPIITWLPNQLFAVMDLMCSVWQGLSEIERADAGRKVNEMMENVEDCREKLDKEVERWCQERGVPSKE
jgi:indoleamine 2,3-dioxygenase